MPLRLDIKRKLCARSERVKHSDFHPTEPWILAALYSGHIFIWNYSTQSMVKSIEVCELPVRCAKFVERKQWIICGADDMQIRIYNYNTMERVKSFEAHSDYIRSIAIHPTLPYVISSSDDMFIKLWDWDKGWECIQVYEGHQHYVMQVDINPKDTNTFASASLDRTIKVWGLNSPVAHFTLEGHEKGVNCIDYYRGGDRPYLVSGADDFTIKVWDYQTKACISTLEGHTNNVSAVCYHPTLPIILSGSEDGTVRIWHSGTYRLENTLNYGMERVWSIACLKNSNKVAIGYDEGTVMIKVGQEEPVVSMEKGGKIIIAKNNDIVMANLRTTNTSSSNSSDNNNNNTNEQDGERVNVVYKELGSCEVYPQSIQHSPNGRLVVVCGDGEYIIYTALSLKNKSFGSGLEFVWCHSDSGMYAVRESSSKIKIFKDFQEHKSFKPTFSAEGIFGGHLLGIRGTDFIDFYDWQELRPVRRVDVCPRKVYWSESGDVCILACDSSFYVLRYDQDIVTKYFDQNVAIGEQGIENAFDLEKEVNEKIRTGQFVGDCFIYTNTQGRLNYYVGGEVITLSHLNKHMYLVGYIPKDNRVYVIDKQHHIYSYNLLVSVLVYQAAIVRRDLDAAQKTLSQIPVEHYNRLAKFLELQDLKDLALEVTQDPEHKFELAMSCNQLLLAYNILCSNNDNNENKWKQIGDAALNINIGFDLSLAQQAYLKANDLSALLLIYTSTGNKKGMLELAEIAREKGHNNIAFACYLLLQQTSSCIDLLIQSQRIPEAAFFTRTYAPSRISEVLTQWKDNLRTVSEKAAQALADPSEYAELFPDLLWAMKVEKYCDDDKLNHEKKAYDYPIYQQQFNRNLIQEMKEGLIEDPEAPQPVAQPAAPVSPPSPVPATVTPHVVTPSPSPVPAPAPVAAVVAESTPQATQSEEEDFGFESVSAPSSSSPSPPQQKQQQQPPQQSPQSRFGSYLGGAPAAEEEEEEEEEPEEQNDTLASLSFSKAAKPVSTSASASSLSSSSSTSTTAATATATTVPSSLSSQFSSLSLSSSTPSKPTTTFSSLSSSSTKSTISKPTTTTTTTSSSLNKTNFGFDDDLGDVDDVDVDIDNNHVPSLDDINKSLAAIENDEDFRDFD